MKTVLRLFIAALALTCVADAGKITRPSYFPICKQSDPEINQCMIEATENVREYLVKGVPELHLPPIEPFEVPEIKIEQGTKSLNIKATLSNVLIHGLSHYKFNSFDTDVENWNINCEVNVPDLLIEGDYEMDGKLLVAPLKGKGRFNITVEAVNGHVTVDGHIVDKEGVNYLLLKESPTAKLEVVKPKVYFDGLFGENKEVGEATNQVINDNVDEVFNDLKEIVEHVVSAIVADLLNKIFGKLPLDVIFPPN